MHHYPYFTSSSYLFIHQSDGLTAYLELILSPASKPTRVN
jgi:hypothetical protein